MRLPEPKFGPTGPTGPQGITGATGASVATGPTGTTGPINTKPETIDFGNASSTYTRSFDLGNAD